MEARCAVLTALIVALATGRQLSPDVSTTVFARNGQQRQPPLVVLRGGTVHGGVAPPPPELEIFAEDPNWASKCTYNSTAYSSTNKGAQTLSYTLFSSLVDEFMVATGADANGVESALDGVRHMSWAAGRTFRDRHMVLLAFADDAQSDGGGGGSCRLTRAVLSASRHTTDAHFVLVAEGFELDATTREDVEGTLDGGGWRSFTAIEVPEFEGFSSAVNRVMKIIPGSSIVAFLSTSAVLLPASTADNNSVPATSKSNGENDTGDTSNDANSEETPYDIFVAYERMKRSSSSVVPSWEAFNNMDPPSGLQTEAAGIFGSGNDGGDSSTGAERARYDPYGRARQRNNTWNHSEGLLVTASPSRSSTNRKRDDGDDGTTLSHGTDIDETEATGRRRSTAGRPHPTPEPRPPPAMRLSNVAPLPLFVFDTETFFALGELDERFAFQGGIAEWISRAKLDSGDQSRSSSTDSDDYCCHASSCRRDGSPRKKRAATGCGTSTGSSCSTGTVQHVHEREWGRRFVGSWPDYYISAGDAVQSRGSTAEESMPDASSPSVHPLNNFGQQDQAGERAFLREGSDGDGSSQPRGNGDPRTSEEAIIDQWNRVPPAKLEALVQADADLFFLPLLLSRQSSGLASDKETDPVGRCASFHSEWMERAPDEVLVLEALDRRRRFPVAVVVVVNDDISLMRAALEEVAVVVEHILVVVSLIPWTGDAKDVSPTLELLDNMLADVDSPTHGKLRVELGSWATESEQREYGNTVIREDPRDFSRVVVMDTGEFWHPVELAKALAEAARHPETTQSQAVMDTYWVSVRSLVLTEVLNVVWLVDPRRCVWGEFRELMCVEASGESVASLFVGREVGGIRRLSYHEDRQSSEQLQLRPISGNLAVVDVNGSRDLAVPLWVTGATDDSAFGSALAGADAVWSKLLEATSSRLQCPNPPCGKGRHIHTDWADLAEEMSRVQGAVVVRRPDLTNVPGMLAPAINLDFVKTLQAYFGIFKSSLFPIGTMIAGRHLAEVHKNWRFVDAIAGGDSAAARYLSMYYADVEVPKRASDGYENTPTLVGMADVFINKLGHVWNEKDYIVPKSCETHKYGPRARISLPTGVKSYEKVFVMAQHWGDAYFHFVVEALPRITLMLDILRENVDIKIAVRASDPYGKDSTPYVHQFLELLGIDKKRVIFVKEEIHAVLAILPSSAPCGKPDTQAVSLLRRALLQALYPNRGGTPFPVSRPVIVLIVRESGRGLNNNEEVREALKRGFPSYDVVEFLGTGPIISQLQLFATASLIVGPHGAGLSNMVVSPLHTPVLEIGPPDCSTCYIHLALKLQHIYARHLVNSDWGSPCLSKYDPNVSEILVLARDLLEGKRQADAADPPNTVDVQ